MAAPTLFCSACERFIHANTRLAAGQTLGQSSTWLATLLPLGLISPHSSPVAGVYAFASFVQLACKLFFFELAFDGFFYFAHRCASPRSMARA